VSHVEYAPRALLGLEKRRDRQTDGRTDGRFPLGAANVISKKQTKMKYKTNRPLYFMYKNRAVDSGPLRFNMLKQYYSVS